jgi:hypothetical protein
MGFHLDEEFTAYRRQSQLNVRLNLEGGQKKVVALPTRSAAPRPLRDLGRRKVVDINTRRAAEPGGR